MPTRTNETLPLTLSEQLDAMLLGWLEHRAGEHPSRHADLKARAILSVAIGVLPEIERFCERWAMTVERVESLDERWAVLQIDGPALPVEGLCALAEMYRR
jgi:hypothetical protein